MDENGNDMLVHRYKPDMFTKFVQTVVAGTLVIGVIGLWTLSNHVATLDERVSNWSVAFQS